MFFKKELQVTRDPKELERVRQMLERAGIKYNVKSGVGSTGDPERGRGLPNVDAGEQYSISVSRKDFKKARSLVKF